MPQPPLCKTNCYHVFFAVTGDFTSPTFWLNYKNLKEGKVIAVHVHTNWGSHMKNTGEIKYPK